MFAEPADQVERRLHRLLSRQPQRVRRHRRLDHAAHGRGRPEEPIGGRESVERLVRSLEVVVLHVQRHPPLAVGKVGEHRAREQLLPQRLPEPLDLAAGLRVVRAALHVRDAVAAQLRLELRRATPRRVLSTLVGQDLARCAVGGQPALERLQHQRAPLVMRQRQAHQVTRVIVEERRHVDPLVPAQQEREQVRLPQLVRFRPLKARHARLGPWLAPRRGGGGDALLTQHAAHRRRRSTDAEEAPQHVADPSTAGPRLRRLHRHDRSALRLVALRALRQRLPCAGCQCRGTALAVTARPLQGRRVADPKPPRHHRRRQMLLHHRTRHRQPHLHRPRRSRRPRALVRQRPLVRPLLACHLSSPSLPRRQDNRRTSARYLKHCKNAHQVVRTAVMGLPSQSRSVGEVRASCGTRPAGSIRESLIPGYRAVRRPAPQ